MAESPLLQATDRGLFCEAGGFYVDPWLPVDQAIITHAHGDHASRDCGAYLCSQEGKSVLRLRMGAAAHVEAIEFGVSKSINGVSVSLHPAGHIRGSSQVRIERRGEVWCVSGDYKLAADPTCTPFEPVACHTFITESTFGLPIYRWRPAEDVWQEVNLWWQANAEVGRASVLFAYSLGKAQRLLSGIDASIGPIYCHGAVEAVNAVYRADGVQLPPAEYATGVDRRDWGGALIVAPPSARATPWVRRFGHSSTGFVSGWMAVRGARRRRAVDRGFTISDHADWSGLNWAIRESQAQRILVTHGATQSMARWLTEQGLNASTLKTPYEGELVEDVPGALDDQDESSPEATSEDAK